MAWSWRPLAETGQRNGRALCTVWHTRLRRHTTTTVDRNRFSPANCPIFGRVRPIDV